MNSMLSEILFDTSYLFIVVVAFIAFFLGLGFMLTPSITLKINDKINTRFSMRKATKKIETAIKSEPAFYKHSKISGSILVLGSLFVLYTLSTFNAYTLIPNLPRNITELQWEWLIDSAQVFFYISCAFIFIFGLVVFIRPSSVKRFENVANHWISTRRGFTRMSADIDFTSKLVSAYPRLFGAFITLLSIIVLYLLLPQLLHIKLLSF